MADNRTASISKTLIAINLAAAMFLSAAIFAQTDLEPVAPDDSSQVVDTTMTPVLPDSADTTVVQIAVDSLALAAGDSIPPYYSSLLEAKSYGDYLQYKTGFLSLQHGAVGQPEMLTKSEMLPGLGALYNGTPFSNQGVYFPFRSGPDLGTLMFENVGQFEITPLSYLGLFAEGEQLSLHSMYMPGGENPSSLTIARGSFGYERSAWRFSRRFARNIGATFSAGFKKSNGYYNAGADYDGVATTGTLVMEPLPKLRARYAFYQNRVRQGILQFDRVINPTLRLKQDIDFHDIKADYSISGRTNLKMDLFHQKNYNHVFDNSAGYHDRFRDYIWGGQMGADLSCAPHNMVFAMGGRRHYLSNPAFVGARSLTVGLLAGDSLYLDPARSLIVKARLRHNNIAGLTAAGSVRMDWRPEGKPAISVAAGYVDESPDLYARYFQIQPLLPQSGDLVQSYSIEPDPELNTKKTYFADITLKTGRQHWTTGFYISAEKVYDDLIPVTEESTAVWKSYQKNVNYKRLTLTADLEYKVGEIYQGGLGATYFIYSPRRLLPEVRYSPLGQAFAYGEFTIREILRDIDISAVYQLRYIGARYYAGFISIISEQFVQRRAYVLDGSILVRFGAFDFRINENNILDFITDNKYDIWGEYTMPPGMVWWQFTWNFKN
jgi:hypothetical protein